MHVYGGARKRGEESDKDPVVGGGSKGCALVLLGDGAGRASPTPKEDGETSKSTRGVEQERARVAHCVQGGTDGSRGEDGRGQSGRAGLVEDGRAGQMEGNRVSRMEGDLAGLQERWAPRRWLGGGWTR